MSIGDAVKHGKNHRLLSLKCQAESQNAMVCDIGASAIRWRSLPPPISSHKSPASRRTLIVGMRFGIWLITLMA
jgi:hypothetical protein